MRTRRRDIDVTQLASTPVDALGLVRQLMDSGEDENRVVYLVSDFREKEWANPSELRALLTELSDADCDLHFVDCAERPQPNLAIVDVRPAEGTHRGGRPVICRSACPQLRRRARPEGATSHPNVLL